MSANKLYYNNEEIPCKVIEMESGDEGSWNLLVRPFSDDLHRLIIMHASEYVSGITINRGENEYYLKSMETDFMDEGLFFIHLEKMFRAK